MKMICASSVVRMPRTLFRVVCGFRVTIESLAPTSRFINVDFPTFGSPTIAT